MTEAVAIGDRLVGADQAVYVIAELSANHGGDLDRAVELINVAADCGADAVKLQTYTADSMTLDVDTEVFTIGPGTLWSGRRLYDLYDEARTPWEWHAELFDAGKRAGLDVFSTPFDARAVDFLEALDPPAHKIASFELVDLDLIAYAASTGRPLIMSTGMASESEIDEAVNVATGAGAPGVVLLRCNSAYPADPREMDLRTITDMRSRWGWPVGLSDHTLDDAAAIASIALGACMIEKHVTMTRTEPGPDSAFSLEPDEFRSLVSRIRETEAALGAVRYGPSPSEQPSLAFRRSLFVVRDVRAGDVIAEDDVRAVRPAAGLAPRERTTVIGRRAAVDIERGTPLTWDLLVDE